MANKLEQLFNQIKEFSQLAEYSFKLFKDKFDLSVSPIEAYKQNLIPKSGRLENETEFITYKFHGLGCELIFKSGIIDFNYIKPNWEFEGVSVYSLWLYIENKNLYETIDKLKDDLQILENQNRIYKVRPPYLLYKMN